MKELPLSMQELGSVLPPEVDDGLAKFPQFMQDHGQPSKNPLVHGLIWVGKIPNGPLVSELKYWLGPPIPKGLLDHLQRGEEIDCELRFNPSNKTVPCSIKLNDFAVCWGGPKGFSNASEGSNDPKFAGLMHHKRRDELGEPVLKYVTESAFHYVAENH